jgi:hypothetical protein
MPEPSGSCRLFQRPAELPLFFPLEGTEPFIAALTIAVLSVL